MTQGSVNWAKNFEVIDERTFKVDRDEYVLADDHTLLIGKDQREAKKKQE